MDDRLIGELNVLGLKPAHQKRSRDLVLKLLNGGLELLKTHDFDALSIERLCAHTDVTIGSFYSRFESKDAFIQAMQRLVIEQSRQQILDNSAKSKIPTDSLAHLMAWFVKGVVIWHREHEGLIRASLRRAASNQKDWTSFRELSDMQLDQMLPLIKNMLGETQAQNRESAIRFAFQILRGTLNNMVLIGPGPFSIHDASTPRLLATAMLKLIEDPLPPIRGRSR